MNEVIMAVMTDGDRLRISRSGVVKLLVTAVTRTVAESLTVVAL